MNLSQYVPTSPLFIAAIAITIMSFIIFSTLLYKADARNDTKAAENISFIWIMSFFIIIPLLLFSLFVDTAPQKEAKTKFTADITKETGYTISKDSANQILNRHNSNHYSDNIIATDKNGNKVTLTYIIDDKTLNLFLAGKPLLKNEGSK